VTYLYRNNTVNKTKLIARAIESMRFFADGKICAITVSLKALEECGCVLADTEGLTDYGMNIGTVETTLCITETDKPQYKVSYRSKRVNVSAAAGVFGGGGHEAAAGCVLSGHIEDVVRKAVKSVTDLMP
jgi:phosphoesterase RecJ-like protein